MKININRVMKHINKIAEYNTSPGEGCSRFSFTPEDRKVRDYLCGTMKELGMSVSIDSVGNIRGRLDGTVKSLPAVMCGSHIDTVTNGGNFDGVLGVVGALEAASCIVENNLEIKNPYEIIIFSEEEGVTFKYNLVGSKALTGLCRINDLKEKKDSSGISMYERLKSFGLDPDNIENDRIIPESIKALIELHIEQGARLDKWKIPVGVVEAIVDLQWYEIEIQGVSNHAGASAMDHRLDPVVPASQIISSIPSLVSKFGDETTVGTSGRINIVPNMPNIIAESVKFTVDLRSRKSDVIDGILNEIKKTLRSAEEKGFSYSIKQLTNADGVDLAEEVVEAVRMSAEEEGIAYRKMVSGSNHDCGIMALQIPAGMIFVPSVDGRSHCKEEFTRTEDIEKGCQVLFKSLLKLLQ